jgi:hypothetical protein
MRKELAVVKTLDDALSTPGVIPEGRYRMEEGFDIFSHIGGDKNEVRLKGRFVPEELRRIADCLDPQAVNVAAIRAEARREAFAEAEAQHLANREGYEVFCRAIGMEPDSYEVIAHQVNAKIARVRREALEEAANVCDGWLKFTEGVSITVVAAETYAADAVKDIADNIRALIEQEPTP